MIITCHIVFYGAVQKIRMQGGGVRNTETVCDERKGLFNTM